MMIFIQILMPYFLFVIIGCSCMEHVSITVKSFSWVSSTHVQKTKSWQHHRKATLSIRNTAGHSSALVPSLIVKHFSSDERFFIF